MRSQPLAKLPALLHRVDTTSSGSSCDVIPVVHHAAANGKRIRSPTPRIGIPPTCPTSSSVIVPGVGHTARARGDSLVVIGTLALFRARMLTREICIFVDTASNASSFAPWNPVVLPLVPNRTQLPVGIPCGDTVSVTHYNQRAPRRRWRKRRQRLVSLSTTAPAASAATNTAHAWMVRAGSGTRAAADAIEPSLRIDVDYLRDGGRDIENGEKSECGRWRVGSEQHGQPLQRHGAEVDALVSRRERARLQ